MVALNKTDDFWNSNSFERCPFHPFDRFLRIIYQKIHVVRKYVVSVSGTIYSVQCHSKTSILVGILLHIRSLCRHFQYGGLLPFPSTSIIIMVLVPSAMSSTNRSYFICIAERGTQLWWARNLDIT